MKNVFFTILAAVLLFSCGSPHEGKQGTPKPGVFPAPFSYQTLEGAYSGDFNGSVIHINLNHVTGRNAVGYAIRKGVRRNISGSMESMGGGFHFVLREPGNDPTDGVYDVLVDTLNFEMAGKWLPRQGGATQEKRFVLLKASDDYFVYADSLNKLFFERNGECRYEFYMQDTDGTEARQMTQLKGSWKHDGDCFTIDWEANTILPAGSDKVCTDSVKTSPENEYYTKYLRINGRILSDYSMM